MLPENFKIANIGDSPKITSGFAQVTKQIYQAQYDFGFQVYALGTMDLDYDTKRELPYVFWPSHMLDEMGHRTSFSFLKNVQPDLINLTYDPGNIDAFLEIILKMQDNGEIKKCPITIYTPIEGWPVPVSTVFTFMKVLETGGRVILYSKGMVDIVVRQYPELEGKLDWVNHGLDHANFRKYDNDTRKQLRSLVGLDDYFVVGSVGVNKRTKGFDYIIYTARQLKDNNQQDNIKFYLHTSKNKPTLLGYNLEDMAKNYDVANMILFKPEVEVEFGGNINGITRESQMSKFAHSITKPNTSEGRKQLFSLYSYIDRMNCLDCYLDLSQVEGWGLCFSPETEITTINGQVPIKNINIGDYVLTHKGNYMRVKNKSMRFGAADRIKTKYGRNIVASPEHPFLAVRRSVKLYKTDLREKEFIECKNLDTNYLVCSVKEFLPNNNNNYLLLDKYVKHPIYNNGYITTKYSNKLNKSGKVFIKHNIEVTCDIAEMIGWYVAEGSSNGGKIEFSMGIDEIKYSNFIIDTILSITKNITYKAITKENRLRTIFSSSLLANILSDICGVGAHNKKIPDIIMYSNDEIRKSFLRGYILGDGYISNSSISISTVSKALADSYKLMLLHFGIESTIKINKTDNVFYVETNGRNFRLLYNLLDLGSHTNIKLSKRTGSSSISDNRHIFFGIEKIDRNVYNGPLYNIEVECDNSYLADYLVVHNCPMEAMKCGVPTLMVEDYSIRSEICDGGVMWIEPEPFRMWSTWQTGAKLVLVDPAKVAETIIEFKNTETKDFWSEIALDQASKYSWSEATKKYNKILSEVLGI